LYPGYWRWTYDSIDIFACPYGTFACIGGNYTGQNGCNDGYHGAVCGVCNGGWYKAPNGLQCAPCSAEVNSFPVSSMITIAFLGALIIGPTIYYIRKWAKKAKVTPLQYIGHYMMGTLGLIEEDEGAQAETREDRAKKKFNQALTSRFKICVATYQIVMNASGTFNINLGPVYTKFMSSITFLSLDFVKLVPFDCYFPFAFIQSMVSTTLMPVFASVIIFSLFFLQRWKLFHREPNRLRRREKAKNLFVRYFALFVMITYMVSARASRLHRVENNSAHIIKPTFTSAIIMNNKHRFFLARRPRSSTFSIASRWIRTITTRLAHRTDFSSWITPSIAIRSSTSSVFRGPT
jgi:hypothetical protein